jgi:hypothetical protein
MPELANAFSVASEQGRDVEEVLAWTPGKLEVWLGFYEWRRMKQEEEVNRQGG